MTATAFTSMAIPSMEDSMEVSSPAGNPFDNDIDIDFDDQAASLQPTDDERMLEDGDQTRPGTATDDMMDDDDQVPVTHSIVVEEEMQDSHDTPVQPAQQEIQDEELIDYDDEAYPDQTEDVLLTDDQYHHPEIGAQTQPSPTTDVNSQSNIDHVDEEIVRHPEGEGAVVQEQVVSQDQAIDDSGTAHAVEAEHGQGHEIDGAESTSAADALAHQEAVLSNTQPTLEGNDEVEAVEQDTHHTNNAQAVEDGARTLKPPPEPPGAIDVSCSTVFETPATPTDTGLHPMMVTFNEHEWPLFKSRAQPEGLLKDDNLVNISLSDLLQNLRQRLALKLEEHEQVSDDQDLVLGFDRIGLMVVEVRYALPCWIHRLTCSQASTHASATSLNDILEVYLQLHHNDSVYDVPPLSMTLTTSLKFTSHLNMLKSAAASGTGLSTFVTINDNLETEIDSYYDEDDGEDDSYQQDDAAGEDDSYQQDDAAGEDDSYQQNEANGEEDSFRQNGADIEEYSLQQNEADVEENSLHQNEANGEEDSYQQNGNDGGYEIDEAHQHDSNADAQEEKKEGQGNQDDDAQDEAEDQEEQTQEYDFYQEDDAAGEPDGEPSQPQEVVYEADFNPAGQYDDYPEDDEHPDPDQVEADAEASRTEIASEPPKSPAIVPVTTTHGIASEYDPEDYIDWDDDSLTDEGPAPPKDSGNEGISTSLQENKDEDFTAEANKDSGISDHGDPEDPELPGAGLGHEEFSNEDFLQYTGEDDRDHAEAEAHEPASHATNAISHTEDVTRTQAEADILHHSAAQANEEEEDDQVPTAFDLFEGGEGEDEQDPADLLSVNATTEPQLDEDDIGFDVDEDETTPSTSKSTPLNGKRSFHETAADDDDDENLHFDDEPEQKKARSE
jgi:hypothetical protein